MKKKILIILLVILLIGLIIGAMYLIDKKRMKDNKSVVFSTWGAQYVPPVTDEILLNSDYRMMCISYATEGKEIEGDLEELKNLKYPTEMTLSRALNVYVQGNTKGIYDELHDIFLLFDGEDKNFSITMSKGKEPLTDYRDPENKYNYQYSLISGNKVAILHNDKFDLVNQKVFYTCLLEYNDVYFVVETTNLTQDEVIALIKSIFECNMKNIFDKEINKTECSFFAKVIESEAKHIIVEPLEGSQERKSSDRISIDLGEYNDCLYEIGTNVKITYNGNIQETYPAKISAINIEVKSTDDFILKFYDKQPENSPQIKKILGKEETEKYDYNIYSYQGNVNIVIDNKEISLRDALLENKITMDEIIAKANSDLSNNLIKGDMYKDGGSMIYQYGNYIILKYHTIAGNRDVYIGVPSMTINIINTLN